MFGQTLLLLLLLLPSIHPILFLSLDDPLFLVHWFSLLLSS